MTAIDDNVDVDVDVVVDVDVAVLVVDSSLPGGNVDSQAHNGIS